MATSTDEVTILPERRTKCASLFKSIKQGEWPVVYSDRYNITFLGMEKLHPFDSSKWGNVFKYLKDNGDFTSEMVVEPEAIEEEQLLEFHSDKYLKKLKSSYNVALICEVPPVALLPICLVEARLLSKLRLQTSGTILAAKLALDRQWSINIGGGFHHCSGEEGGGFCAYADISGALKTMKEEGMIDTALIVDLDAHQGNGHERDFIDVDWVHTLDIFNGYIYPGDLYAKGMLNLRKVELKPHTRDDEYLDKVRRSLDEIFARLDSKKPDLIAYNAGTDVLIGDPLGLMDITDQGIIKRDEMVFQKARDANIPIFMVLSGGYQSVTAKVIADSILNLKSKGLISN